MKEGKDEDMMFPRDKHREEWLVGRQGTQVSSIETITLITEPLVEELNVLITQNLEAKMEGKVEKFKITWLGF